MHESVQSSAAAAPADGARDLQAKLYREIGISAVAAALHSINQPEPGKRPSERPMAARPAGQAAVRAA